MAEFIDFLLHIDRHLQSLISQYGFMAHGFLFLIIFLETGLVIMPFLPGDSLLFAAGLMAQPGRGFNIYVLLFGLPIASIVGDSVNFWLGKSLGGAMVRKGWIKKKWITETEKFYAKHGKKTVIIGRFVPIVRTVAPFVAGMEIMPYRTYLPYCVAGSFLWVFVCVGAGYLLGGIPWVEENFELVILGVIFLSIIAIILEVIREKRKKKIEINDSSETEIQNQP
jgi:membrane-associated protein